MEADLGATLRACRLKRKLSQEQVASQVDTSVASVKRWEHGIGPPPGKCFVSLIKLFPDAFLPYLQAGLKSRGERAV
jgi:transcriptional regulator with XRE-family HTH domain